MFIGTFSRVCYHGFSLTIGLDNVKEYLVKQYLFCINFPLTLLINYFP